MKTSIYCIIAIGVLSSLQAEPLNLARKDLDQKIASAQSRLESLQKNKETAIPPEVLRIAKGIIILRNTKMGLGFRNEPGGGVALVRNAEGKWSAPAFVGAKDANWGKKIRAQNEDIVILMMTEGALCILDKGKQGNLMKATAADGPIDFENEGNSYRISPVLIYRKSDTSIGKTEMKAGSLIGAQLRNKLYYGKSIGPILKGEAATSTAGENLINSINKFSEKIK